MADAGIPSWCSIDPGLFPAVRWSRGPGPGQQCDGQPRKVLGKGSAGRRCRCGAQQVTSSGKRVSTGPCREAPCD